MNLIFELSKEGKVGANLPQLDIEQQQLNIPISYWRQEEPEIPEVSEVDVVRHYTALSRRNHGLDNGFYPLGSCTMKYNPKINEDIAVLDGFSGIHPYAPEELAQGALEVMYNMDKILCEITGMDRVSLQPAAGAHGELTGIMIIKAYHESQGDKKRDKIIIPDSAHGTNPATASMVGYKIVEVKSDDNGGVNIEALKQAVGEDTAGLMLTNPNTLGLFDPNITEISKIVHDAGGLLYYDGANLNAIMGITRPGDMGFDVVHLNLHKTFSTPHGGGGPGSGPVGVKKHLEPFLPVPLVEKDGERYFFDYDRPNSIGKVKAFYGNFNVILKAYSYILSMGAEGLKAASETAVLSANYMMNRLKEKYNLPYSRLCMHEFVLAGLKERQEGITTLDIAKRLLDFEIHPPTIYFPLIVKEAMMIEPTETESKETLDSFIEIMNKIAEEAVNSPELLKHAPHNTPVRRLNETQAARQPVLRWKK
ncbi:MAG: aminomethyl-transferring glycine dehydrogenase subunit GcvPB [Deltaproteobacteria bacterium]